MFKKFKREYRYKKVLAMYQEFSCDTRYDWDWEEKNYNRIALVNHLIQESGAKDYLEIGCQQNNLFNCVPLDNKVGVDPERGGNQRMTSDEFFAKNTDTFDIIFVDGLHTYEQVRVDIQNALKVIKPNGYIAVHDMLPRDWIEAFVPCISQGPWSGDVWKVAFELMNTPELDFKIVRVDTGVGVIKAPSADCQLTDLRSTLQDAKYQYFCDHLDSLPTCEWDAFSKWVKE